MNPLDKSTNVQTQRGAMYQYFTKARANEHQHTYISLYQTPKVCKLIPCINYLASVRPQVVPTYYQDINGGLLRTNQFSVTEHVKDVDLRTGKNMPGVFFFYDINPIQVGLTSVAPRPVRGQN